MKIIIIFLITTFSGYFIGNWISFGLNMLFPKFFAIDPNFIQKIFLKKPTMTSNVLGYIIYATTALVMFSLSSVLNNFFEVQKEDTSNTENDILENDE